MSSEGGSCEEENGKYYEAAVREAPRGRQVKMENLISIAHTKRHSAKNLLEYKT